MQKYHFFKIAKYPSILTIGIAIIISVSNFGCNKSLDVDSQHIVNEENKWQDVNDVRASLLGAYGLMRSALAENNAFWMYGDLRDGDFNSLSRRDLQVIIDGQLTSSYELVDNLSNWRKFYAVINAANIFIEHSSEVIDKDPQYTALNNQVDIAQMRALKGFCYFLMARIWGEVPIWDKAYEGGFPQFKKSTEKEVLAYAEKELKSAISTLPYRYGYQYDQIYPALKYHGYDNNRWDGVLFNRLSVNAILAHLAAWSGNYFEASVYSEYVLTNALKSNATYVESNNLTKADGFFYNSSQSQLVAFPFKWSTMESSYDGHIEQLALAAPLVSKSTPDIFIPADRIVSIFKEEGDIRFHIKPNGSIVTSYFTDFGGIRPLFSKIKVIRQGVSGTDGSLPIFSSAIVFSRLEDIALLRAESLAQIGEVDLAKNILNQIRKSRGLGEINSSSDLIDEIFAERRRELMGEGSRWFDLVRYNKIKRNNPEFNKLITEKGIFWPISAQAIQGNPNLTQNPYWK